MLRSSKMKFTKPLSSSCKLFGAREDPSSSPALLHSFELPFWPSCHCEEALFVMHIAYCEYLFSTLPGTDESLVQMSNVTNSNSSNCNNGNVGSAARGSPTNKSTPGRRKKPSLSSRERNVRRIESNERERLRMHGLNEAFQVNILQFPAVEL